MATQLFQPAVGSAAWFHSCVDRSKDGIVTERVVMTPALAAEMLRNNDNNRFLRPAKMAQITADIRAGRWVFNGEPIIISKEGKLNDGQHRSAGVVETNIPIEVLLVFGLERESRTTIDQGAARTAGDYLEMDGVENATTVGSIAHLLISYQLAEGKSLGDASRVSNGEVMARAVSDTRIAAAATFASSMHRYSKKFAAPSLVGFCHVLMSRINPTAADTFLRQVLVGENIKKSDPAFAVREGLFRERVTRGEKAHLIFRGWNAYRQGRKLDLAKVTGQLPALI